MPTPVSRTENMTRHMTNEEREARLEAEQSIRRDEVTLTCPKFVSDKAAKTFWEQTIERMDEEQKKYYTYLRNAFSSLLITGPFSIMVGFDGGLMALNDRLKLRSLVVGEQGDTVYLASEESAIRTIAPDLDRLYAPRGGEPVIVTLNERSAQ